LAQVLPVVAIVSLFPVLPVLGRHFSAAPHAALLIPMIITLPSLSVALFSPVVGLLADRFGRRPCLIGSLALYLVAGLAPLFLEDLGVILATRALVGVAEAGILTVSSALIGDYFGERRHRWLGWVGIAQSVCGPLLIAAGGALADISWKAPFLLYAVALPNLILALLVIDEPSELQDRGDQRARTAFPWSAAARIGVVSFVVSIFYYVEPLHLAAVLVATGAGSATQVGLIQSATSLVCIAGALLYRRLAKLPFGWLLTIEGVLLGAGLILIASATTYPWAAAGSTIKQLSSGMVIPSLLAWGQALLPVEQRARGMGIWATAFSCGSFVCAPIVSAVGLGVGGLQPALMVIGVAVLPLALLAPFLLGPRAPRALSAGGR
jgi:MFS family permease